MSKPNELKLRNKSLLALSGLLKLDKENSNPTASFLRTLAPRWPDGRQILYDLFSNNNIWIQAMFSNRHVSNSLIEIMLVLSIHPNMYDAYQTMIKTWSKDHTKGVPSDSYEFCRHRQSTRKIFRKGETNNEYLKRTFQIINAVHIWYV